MSDLVKTRWRPRGKVRTAPQFLRALDIPFRQPQADHEDFWAANRHVLRELYDLMQEAARERFHELHPDKGGDTLEFREFLAGYKRAKAGFARYLGAAPQAPASVKFTPIAQVRRDKRAAQARARRKARPAHYQAAAQARYARKKAAGWRDVAAAQRSRDWQRRHRRKARNMQKRYRRAHPEKVREFRQNYKASCARRGIQVTRGEGKARLIRGTPEYERRRQWRLDHYQKNKTALNAKARAKRNAPPRVRDHKGRYLSRHA